MHRRTIWNLLYWLVAIGIFMYFESYWRTANQSHVVPYSEFEKALAGGQIKDIFVSEQTITGNLKTPVNKKTALVSNLIDPNLAGRLDKYGIPYTKIEERHLAWNFLSLIIPVLLTFLLWVFLFRTFFDKQGSGSFLSIGKSQAKLYMETHTGITFADVAGVDEAKYELEEVVDFLKHPDEYGRLGAHIPKGVLLVGPPGTGKTLLAKAVAGQAGVPFFYISGSQFVEMFVGVGAARVRDLFEQARAQAPAIIFIDELDALGRMRGAFAGLGGHDEKEQTLNQLLSEMDGFDPSVGLIILSATNRPEILDPALLRAGRFDRQILVDRPDRQGRIDILKVHIRKIRTDPQLSLDEIAALTPGFSGADLANLVNEAALQATRSKKMQVTLADFNTAVERIVAGLEHRSRILNHKERELVAYHEMGHALVALAQKGSDPVHKVSIIPRGIGALGYTIQRPSEDRYLATQQELVQKMAVLLGGRAAEKIIFNELSTGAADDLVKASDLARSMVTRFGMDEHLGHVAYDMSTPKLLDTNIGLTSNTIVASEHTLRQIDDAIKQLVMAGFTRAYKILADNKSILERGSKQLLDKESLDEAAIRQLSDALIKDTLNPNTQKPLDPVCAVKLE